MRGVLTGHSPLGDSHYGRTESVAVKGVGSRNNSKRLLQVWGEARDRIGKGGRTGAQSPRGGVRGGGSQAPALFESRKGKELLEIAGRCLLRRRDLQERKGWKQAEFPRNWKRK